MKVPPEPLEISAVMVFVQLNGKTIFCQDSGGCKPAVILAPGFLMDSSMFVPQVAALSDVYRVITWDERGFGQTISDGEPFTDWDLADDCLAWMIHVGIESLVVGGMSQGGLLSLPAALIAPHG
jgi:pimeloyl-ACP methyl ester carboxylesterase